MSETDINATVNVTEDIYADVDSTAMSAAVIDDGDSIVVPAEVDFGHTLDTELEDNDLIDVPVDESVGIAGDHRVLLHRDAANQHPMSAITGLNDALAGIDTALSSRISQVEAETAELDVDMADALLRIGELQDQVDGNITTWFYAAEPAMNLPPVAYDPSNPHDTGWDTDDKKNEHKGDLYYNTLTGYAYRFAYSDGAYGWLRITDTDVVKALADAAHAQDTADSKRRVFYTTPTPPYDKGDLWVQGGSGDILVCSTEKPADGSYSESDWSLASKYTDDTVADIALASANSKNTVYHQASQPTGGTYKKGDTWFDTDDDYTMYTYDGSLWIKEQFGNEALADLSVTNAKIANATIEYGKIKSVDAGKITVGDLSADRMKVNSISAINGNTGTVKISAGKIDIAGTITAINNDTTTTIDGDKITTGTLSASAVDATSGTFNTANIPNLNASKITAGDISADRMKVNSISAINNNTGSVQISASKVDIAGAAVFNNYSTTAQMNTAINNAVDAKKSIHTLDSSYNTTYQQLLTWTAPTYTGGFAVTSTAGVKAGDTCRIKATVSDMNNAVVYMVVTVNSVASSTSIYATGCGLDTTVIDGGNILTNSIGANQIKARSIGASKLLVTDDTNLITVTELDANSLQSEMGTPKIENGYLIKNTATQAELGLTPKQISNFKQNDEIYYEFRIKAAAEGAIRFGIWGYDANGSYISGSFIGNTITATTSEQFVSGYIKLTPAVWTDTVKKYVIGINDDKTTKSQLYVRKAVARRKSAGELIVDGSVTADKLAANSIVVGKMNDDTKSQVLNSNIQIGGRNFLANDAFAVAYLSNLATPTSKGFSYYALWASQIVKASWIRANFEPSTTYTISFDYEVVSIESGITDARSQGIIASSEFGGLSIGIDVSHRVAGYKTHCEKTWTTPSSVSSANLYWYTFYSNSNRRACQDTIRITNLKIEKGNKATDWSPAPEELAATATNYISADSSGIRIASADPATQNQRIQLTSSEASFYGSDNQKRVSISSGSGVIVGCSDKGHTTVTDSGLTMYDTNNKKRSQVDANGLNVFDTDGSTSVASFGSTARVGKIAANSGNVRTTSTGMDLYVNATKVGSLFQKTNYAPEYESSTYNNALFINAAQYVAITSDAVPPNGSDPGFPIMESNAIDTTMFSIGAASLFFEDDYDPTAGGQGAGGVVLSLQNPNWNRTSHETKIEAATENAGVWLGIGSGGTNHGVFSVGADKWIIAIQSDGTVFSPQMYAKTTSGGSNLRVETSGTGALKRYVSSSRRYKEDIKNIEDEALDPNKLYDVRVVQFRYKDDYLDDTDQRYGKTVNGFIAEELEEIYPIAVNYEDEMPEDWEPKFLIPPMLKLIQDQKKKIDELEQRLEALERR